MIKLSLFVSLLGLILVTGCASSSKIKSSSGVSEKTLYVLQNIEFTSPAFFLKAKSIANVEVHKSKIDIDLGPITLTTVKSTKVVAVKVALVTYLDKDHFRTINASEPLGLTATLTSGESKSFGGYKVSIPVDSNIDLKNCWLSLSIEVDSGSNSVGHVYSHTPKNIFK